MIRNSIHVSGLLKTVVSKLPSVLRGEKALFRHVFIVFLKDEIIYHVRPSVMVKIFSCGSGLYFETFGEGTEDSCILSKPFTEVYEPVLIFCPWLLFILYFSFAWLIDIYFSAAMYRMGCPTSDGPLFV